MHQDTLAGTYSQYTGKAPQNFLFFLLNCEGFPLHTGGRKPQPADKEGQPGSSWAACPGSGPALHPAALPGSGLQLCRSGASFKKQMGPFFILLLSFAALLQIFVFCRLFVSPILGGGESNREHLSRREGEPYTQPGGVSPEQKGLAGFCSK